MRRPDRARTRLAALLLGLVVGAAGCTIPSLETGPTPTTEPTLLGASPADPLAPAVRDIIAELVSHSTTVVDGLREALEEGQSIEEQRAAAGAAVRALTANDAFGHDAGPADRPLLPGPESSREAVVDWNDLLTDALRAGREVGGDRLLGVLSDPIAGDLGAWQRDPGGVYETVTDALAETSEDLDATGAAIATLDGQALRALAWLELAADPNGVADPAVLIERAVAHLDIVHDAVAALAADVGIDDAT